MSRSPSLLVKAGEVPRHRATSALASLNLAITPAAHPPVEPLPAAFALVGRPSLDEVRTWTTVAFPELGDCPRPLLPPHPPVLPSSCIKYLEEGGQRQKREGKSNAKANQNTLQGNNTKVGG